MDICPQCVAGANCPPCSKGQKIAKGTVMEGEEKSSNGGTKSNPIQTKYIVINGLGRVDISFVEKVSDSESETKPFFTTQTLVVMGVLGLIGMFVAYKLLK